MKGTLLAAVVLVSCATLYAADVPLTDGTAVHLADAAEGAAVLGASDAFSKTMGSLERSVRMGTPREVTEKDYLEFVAGQARSFTDAEAARIVKIVENIRGKIQRADLKLNFPPVVTFIKTTGKDEGDASYCRGSAVILPQGFVGMPVRGLEQVIIHELFHILTNADPGLRAKLYPIVGFTPCADVELPAEIAPRRLTNPDALRHDFYTEVSFEGADVKVVPVLLMKGDKFDPEAARIFDYLTFSLLAVDRKDGSLVARYSNGRPLLIDPDKCPDYGKRLGGNTGYIIHPEEALADNFVFVVNGTKDLPDESVPSKMRKVLSQ